MYFFEHKRVVKIDDKGHTGWNQNEESERQIKIEKHPDCKFFHRINPDAEGFDIFLKLIKYKITSLNQTKKKLKELENTITDQEDKIKEQENKIKEQKRKFAKELRVTCLAFLYH